MTPIDYDGIAGLYDSYAVWDHDVAFFVDQARRVAGPVLELMAGTGRVSLPLAEAGVRLTCVDASAGMLAVLSRKLAARGLHADVVHADVRALALPAAFDLALLPFNAFMELVTEADQRAALAAVAACLRPGGRFVCTLHNPAVRKRRITGEPESLGAYPMPGTGRCLTVTGAYHLASDPSIVRGVQVYVEADADGRVCRRVELGVVFRLIEPAELGHMAIQSGFELVELFGNYDRSPFDPSSSPFLIGRFRRRD